MTNFDILLIAVMAVGLIVGLFRGLVREAVSTFGILMAAIIANLASPLGEEYLGSWFDTHTTGAFLAWVVTFIVALVALFLLSRVVDKLLKGLSLGWANRLAGGLFGALKYALICALVISGIQMLSSILPALSIQEYVEQSQIVPLLHQVIGMVMPWFSDHLLNPALELLRHPA